MLPEITSDAAFALVSSMCTHWRADAMPHAFTQEEDPMDEDGQDEAEDAENTGPVNQRASSSQSQRASKRRRRVAQAGSDTE